MNKTFRKAMLSTICMLVVAVVSLTGVTYAWFSQATYAEVSGLNVQVEAATGGIMINANDTADLPSTDYTSTLNLQTTFGGNGVSPVSTVGGKDGFTFYTAVVEGDTTITTTADSSNANVYKKYLFLKNENTGENMTINLGGNLNGEVLQSNPTEIESSKDIKDAARIGLRYVTTKTAAGGTTSTVGSVNGSTGFGIFSNTGDEYYGVKAAATFDRTSTTDETNLGAVAPIASTDWEIYVPNNSIVVVELLVWVEGQDAACINANANSLFSIDLIFDKVSSTPVEEAD